MLTEKYLNDAFNLLVEDETFCRLAYYFSEPLDEGKADVKSLSNYEDIIKDMIRFSPQTADLEREEKIRICMYKQFTKIKVASDTIVMETIQFDIYMPNRLIQYDKRPYQLENRICELLDGIPMGIGRLEYVNGLFVKMPNVSGYSEYDMTFSLNEGRRPSARY